MKKALTLPALGLLFLFPFLSSPHVFAQCSSAGGTDAGLLVPTSGWQTISVDAGDYFRFYAEPCTTYTFSFCGNGGSAGFDTQLTVTDDAGGGIYYGYSDDACSLQSELGFTPTSVGFYRILTTQYSCNNSGAAATLAYNAVELSTVSGDFNIINDAVAPSVACVQLTSNTTDQRGCAWDRNSTLDFNTSFSYDFTVNLGASDGGADGIAFVMQNDPQGRCVCGASGGSMGAGGITNSLIIEIDTYLNTEDRDDGMPSTACSGGGEPDHLDIWLNGDVNPSGASCPSSPGARIIPAAIELMDGASAYNIENGLDHIFRVSWNAGSGSLTATVLDIGGSTPYGSVSYNFDPLTVFGTQTPYFGFTGSTGGLTNEQSFCIPLTLLGEEIVDFQALPQDGQAALLIELSEDHHLQWLSVQRSTDLVTWEPIHSLTATSLQPTSYHLLDDAPGADRVHYRLEGGLLNGRSVFSPIRSLSFDLSQAQLRAWPNPLPQGGALNLQLSGTEEASTVILFDLQGRKLRELSLPPHLVQGLDCQGLPAGSYFLSLRGPKPLTLRLQIQ